MAFKSTLARRVLFAIVVWFAAELVLFYAASQTIGVLASVAFMAAKGLGGLVLFARALRTGLRKAAEPRRGLGGIADALFAALGALLILIPGFLAPLAGIALFSPSARIYVVRKVKDARSKRAHPDIVSLEKSEWREVSARRPRRSPRKVRSLVP